MTQATRSALMSVATTLAANIDATQDYIPVASTANFSTSVVAEVESTNEVVSFSDISSNRFTYSEQFDNAAWYKSVGSISANAGVAPDGTTTADKFIPTSALSSNHMVQKNSFTSESNTVSIYAKPAGYNFINAAFEVGASTSQGVQFNISTGVVVTSLNATGTITDAGDGWYRCTVTPSNATASGSIHFQPNDGTAANTSYFFRAYFSGDDSSGVLMWGAQVEEASAATTYLPTVASALVGLTGVTRGANGTTAASATSGDDIQQLPFAAQGLLSPVSTTLSANITAAQDYVPLTSTNGFTDYLNATIDSSEVVSFDSITTNRVTYSQQFDNAAWSKSKGSISANAGVAPDGTTTADKWIPDTSSAFDHNFSQTITSVSDTFSIFAKPDGYDYISLIFFVGASTSQGVQFNISTGVVVTSQNATGTITDAGDGWYRCAITPSNTTSSAYAVCQPTDSSTPNTGNYFRATFTGDGSKGVLCWGAQLEEAAAVTGYLPTVASSLSGLTTVTRGANGTTAASATSGDTVTQTPLSTGALNMPLRLKGLSVSSDGTGAGRLTLCDKVGTHLCDVDIPDTKIFDLTFDGGILFPNGIYVANSDNITAYTLYTSGYNSPNLTAGG